MGGLGSGWNSPSIDFKPLSLNTGVGSKSSSSPLNMMGVMSQHQEPNSLNQLAREAARTTNPRHNSFSRKRELSLEKTSSLPNKKAVYADSSLDPPRSLPMMTVPPPATRRRQARHLLLDSWRTKLRPKQ